MVGNIMEELLSERLNLQALLRRWVWFFRLRRSISGAVRGLIFGLAVVLGLCLIAVLSGYGLRYGLGLQEYLRFLFLSAGIGIAAAGLGAFLWPVEPSRVARLVDSTYHLQERLSTAEELSNKSGSLDAEMAHRQLTDAVNNVRAVLPETSFFWPVSRPQLLVCAGLVLAAIAVVVFGQPYFQQAAERQVVRQAIQSEIIRLQELQQTIQDNPDLTPEDKASLQEKLQQTVRKLEQAESLEQAVAALSETQQELEAMDSPQAQEQAQALRQLGNQILQNENGGAALDEFGQALANGDPLAAAQSLENMDLENMSAEERQALADQLSQAADAVQDTNPQLAQQLSQAARALESNDTASAQQALEQAADELNQTGAQLAQASAVQEAAAQAGSGAERLIQAGRSSQTDLANASGQSGQGDDTSENQGSGQADGQGASSQPGDSPGSGSGSGKGSQDQGNPSGNQAGDEPIEQGNGPGDGGERPFVPLSEAQRLGGSGSADVYLPESGVPGDEVTGEGNTNPAQPGSSSVPYVEVFPTYEEAYRQAIESGSVPPSMRYLVQKYFSNLEP